METDEVRDRPLDSFGDPFGCSLCSIGRLFSLLDGINNYSSNGIDVLSAFSSSARSVSK